MKHLILAFTLILISPFTYAKPPVVFSDVLNDTEVANVEFKVIDVDEPVFLPYRLSVTVKCVDRRSQPNSVKPKTETIIKDVAICSYRPHDYNSGSKTITLQYSVARTIFGDATCDDNLEQDINLAEVCEVWQR